MPKNKLIFAEHTFTSPDDFDSNPTSWKFLLFDREGEKLTIRYSFIKGELKEFDINPLRVFQAHRELSSNVDFDYFSISEDGEIIPLENEVVQSMDKL